MKHEHFTHEGIRKFQAKNKVLAMNSSCFTVSVVYTSASLNTDEMSDWRGINHQLLILFREHVKPTSVSVLVIR